jgi:hypothetical protein
MTVEGACPCGGAAAQTHATYYTRTTFINWPSWVEMLIEWLEKNEKE